MRSNFVRKIAYMGTALAIFVVILFVRRPIEEIRVAHRLSDATLGDVDPTSSTMVLVLGGLRGIAANLLWSQAIEMQREHDWTNLEVVVKSIVKLEPHFISIWTFQGWNLAYNVSVEWDQVEDKYYWIKQGIKFLRRGTEMNEHSPELRWDVGWTYFHKIGKADEAVLLRKLYREDDDPEIDAQGRELPPFNSNGHDNYMESLGWFQQAVDTADALRVKPKRMGEVAFRSYPAHAQTNSVQAEEEEGNFGELIQAAWLQALELWTEFADHEYAYTDQKYVKLDYPAEVNADMYRAVTLMTRTRALREGLARDWTEVPAYELLEYARLVWSEYQLSDLEKLTPEERRKLRADWAAGVWAMILRDTPPMLEQFGQQTIDILPPGAAESLQSLVAAFDNAKSLDPASLAREDSAETRRRIDQFGEPAEKLGGLAHEELYWCDRYASMINYRYWKERTVCESEKETITARRHFFNALARFREGDPVSAKDEFEQGLELWKTVLDRHPRVREDDLTGEETVKVLRAYFAVRDQLDLPPLKPDELPFPDYLHRFAPQQAFTAEQQEAMMKMYQEAMSGTAPDANKPANVRPLQPAEKPVDP